MVVRLQTGVDWRALRRMVLAGLFTVGLSAVILLSLWANQGQLGRHPPEREAGWVTPLWPYVVSFYFNPDPNQQVGFFDPTTQTWQDEWRIDELAEIYYSFVAPIWFVGLIVFLIPLYRPRWNRLWWVAGALLIFFTLWGAGGQPIFVWLYAHIPPLRGWRFVGRALAVASFWLAILLAMRVDSLWRIIRTTSWSEKGIGSVLSRRLPIMLNSVLIVASVMAGYEVNQQWKTTANNVLNPIYYDDICVSWLRQQYPDRELAIWRWNYQGITTLMNNRVRTYRTQADFEMLPVPSTIGKIDLTRSFPEFAVLDSDYERESMPIQGYEVVEDSPSLPNWKVPCLYRKADALSYIYTVPVDIVANAPAPIKDMYTQRFELIPPDATTPVTTYQRQPDNIAIIADGSLMEDTVLTVQERAYPGWRVEVDGRPAKLESVGGQIGVILPRDRAQHTIYFEYRPPLVILGGWITLATAGFYSLYVLEVDRKRLIRLFHRLKSVTAHLAVPFTIAGVAAMVISALGFRAENGPDVVGQAAGWMRAGILMIGGALLAAHLSGHEDEPLSLPEPALETASPRSINRHARGWDLARWRLLVIFNIAAGQRFQCWRMSPILFRWGCSSGELFCSLRDYAACSSGVSEQQLTKNRQPTITGD